MRYTCRALLHQAAYEYELLADRIVCNAHSRPINLYFSDILEIIVFKERMIASSRSYWACTIRDNRRTVRLTAAHRVGITRIDDRTESYIPFIKEFERRSLAANCKIRFINDEYRETVTTKLSGLAAVLLIKVFAKLPRKQAGLLCGLVLRHIGWIFKGDRNARRQLRAAFPGLSTKQARLILHGMWDNIGRTFAEYAHVKELMNFSTEKLHAGEIIMDDCTAALLRQLGSDTRGALLFAAHLGNWEIPAMAAQVIGRDIALIYKRQPSSRMTDALVGIRSLFAARLVEATPTAPRDIFKLLQQGWLVGMLVDQYFASGVNVSFFGKTCMVNPIMARLARRQDWPIYGARTVRLPDQRHRFELVGPLDCPRDPQGRIDVQATTQQIVSLVESWIREHPEQWMWLHRLIREAPTVAS